MPDDDLMSEARGWAERLASGPTLGFALTKEAIHASSTNSLSDHLELEADMMKRCGESAPRA